MQLRDRALARTARTLSRDARDELLALPAARAPRRSTGTSEPAAPHQVIQRGIDLAIAQVAGRAEQHQSIGVRRSLTQLTTGAASRRGRRSRGASRTAACRANSAWPREAKRENSAALSTYAGTPSSIAACSVQRPSPESATRPAKRLELRIGGERGRRDVQQLRGDDAAVPPELGDRGDVEPIRKQLRIGRAAPSRRPPGASRGRHRRAAGY